MDRRGLWIALRILALSPVVLAGLMFLLTPTYFRPMLNNIVGWLLLGIFVVIIGVGFALGEASNWLFRNGRAGLGVLLLVGYSMAWFVAVWIVLLGPAALILMKPVS